MFQLRGENPSTKEVWFCPASSSKQQADAECRDAQRVWPHLNFSVVTNDDFTAAELRARIYWQTFGRFPEDERDELRDEQAEQDASEESRYSLRDEGRNDDGTGESYAERNA